MNNALVALAKFTRDLLSVSESNIFIGRRGFRREDFTGQQITIDSLGQANLVSTSTNYDDVAESMEYSNRFVLPCTINFYGDTAWADATRFSILPQSQSGYELQRDLGIAVYNIGGMTDVRLLTGEQYSGRIEIELNLGFTVVADVSTLRIDEAQLDDFLWEE